MRVTSTIHASWVLISLAFLLATASPAVVALPSTQQGLNTSVLANVRDKMIQNSRKSWELGTAAETLLELEWPSLSVYGKNPVPPPFEHTNDASDVLAIARQTLTTRAAGSMTLMADTAVGDPASLGVAVLLANWSSVNTNVSNYSSATSDQLDYLLNVAPRATDGTISHRSEYVQLWSDFVYMAPPFISYFGALQGGVGGHTNLREAFNQVSLYRDHLRDEDTGLWKHVVEGPWQDTGLWATGNGWAAAGMLRTYQAIRNSDAADELRLEQGNLTEWISEIINATWIYQQNSGSLRNYLSDSSSFEDSSGTALLAYATYRLAVITNDTTHIPAADLAFSVIQSRIDQEGFLHNVVDPYNFGNQGSVSPEGQAFVLLLQAAWRDYQQWVKMKI